MLRADLAWNPATNADVSQLFTQWDATEASTVFRSIDATDDKIPPPENEEVVVQTIVATDYVVPQLPGLEVCTYHKNPTFDNDDANRHITKVEAFWAPLDQNGRKTPWSEGGSGFAHHITLLSCSEEFPEYQDGGFIGSPEQLASGTGCAIAWDTNKMGCTELTGQVNDLLNDEGLYYSNKNAKSFVFLRHFYNHHKKQGVVDHGTTFRITHTKTLRPWTVNKLVMATLDLSIPAHTVDYHQQVLCPKDCIKRGGEMMITSANIHMHDRGNSNAKAAKIRHIRNGVELPPIFELDNFVEQSASEGWFNIDTTVLPTDDLLFECIYDNPSDVTDKWGSGFYDQMCRSKTPLSNRSLSNQESARGH